MTEPSLDIRASTFPAPVRAFSPASLSVPNSARKNARSVTESVPELRNRAESGTSEPMFTVSGGETMATVAASVTRMRTLPVCASLAGMRSVPSRVEQLTAHDPRLRSTVAVNESRVLWPGFRFAVLTVLV